MARQPVLAVVWALTVAASRAADPDVRAVDGGFSVKADTYTATVDRGGQLALRVGGVAAGSFRFGPPDGKPPAPVVVTAAGRVVTVKAGAWRSEYTFGARTVAVATEGFAFEGTAGDGVVAAFAADSSGGPVSDDSAYPHTAALVLKGDVVLRYSAGLHVVGRRLVPSAYTTGAKKPGDPLAWEFAAGDPAGPDVLLGRVAVAGVQSGYGLLADGGNAGEGVVHFPDAAVGFRTTQPNSGGKAFTVAYKLTVTDHHTAGREVAALARSADVPAGGRAEVDWPLPPLAPGFYYLTLTASVGGKVASTARLTFAVRLADYDHPPTAPADFKAFWARQQDRLAKTPADPELKEVSPPGAADKYFTATLAMPGGKTLDGVLFVPAKKSAAPAVVSALVGTARRELLAAAARPGHTPAADRLTFWVVLPDDGTHRRWAAADDNNLLDCVLGYLRAVDYLAARPDADPKRVFTFGASRAGPPAFIAAALRPGNVCGTQAHVPTSAGISWTDMPYGGWGVPAGHDPTDPERVKALAGLSAYVDPVNHAPFVTCPVILGYGIDDHGLSPPQGIEVMYRRAASRWKRIARDAGGHVYSAGFQSLEKKLAEHLGTGVVADPGRDRILTDH